VLGVEQKQSGEKQTLAWTPAIRTGARPVDTVTGLVGVSLR
jgi:hypothetical protein